MSLNKKSQRFTFPSSFTPPPPPPPQPSPSFLAHDVAPIIHKTSDTPTLILPRALARFRIDVELHHLRSIAYSFKNEKMKGGRSKGKKNYTIFLKGEENVLSLSLFLVYDEHFRISQKMGR
jgi:hypothetical protein